MNDFHQFYLTPKSLLKRDARESKNSSFGLWTLFNRLMLKSGKQIFVLLTFSQEDCLSNYY